MFLGARYVEGTAVDTVRTYVGSEAVNLGRNAIELPGQRYEMALALKTDQDNARGLHRRLAAHYDRHGHTRAFDLPVPQPPGTGPGLPAATPAEQAAADVWNTAPWNAGLGVDLLPVVPNYLLPYLASDRLVLTAKASAGATTVNVRRATPTRRDLAAGRFVTFAGGTKVHRVVDDYTFPDTSTVRTVAITPALRGEVAAGSYIRLNPTMLVRYDPDTGLALQHRAFIFRPPTLAVYEVV